MIWTISVNETYSKSTFQNMPRFLNKYFDLQAC